MAVDPVQEERDREYRQRAAEEKRVRDAKLARMTDILRQHGIVMSAWGGQDYNLFITFIYQGETILDEQDDADFDMRKEG